MVLHQKLNFVTNCWREYDDDFGKDGAKIGSTLRIRLPNQYLTSLGAAITPQDTVETSTTLAITQQRNVPLQFLSSELTLSIDDFSERIIEPAAAVLASGIEADALNMVNDVSNSVGTPGTPPTDFFGLYMSSKATLDLNLAPQSQRYMIVGPFASANVLTSLKGLFNPQDTISKQYHEGVMGRTADYDWYMNTLLPSFTPGTNLTGVSVTGGGQTGASLITGGWAAAQTVKKGQVFTLAGVFQVHPETKQSTGVLQQFTVTADQTAAGAAMTLAISPSIVTTGAYQNVSNSPAGATPLVFVGTASTAYTQAIGFHKQAFTFAAPPLFMPKGVDMGSRQTMDGISMRLIRDYVPTSDLLITRLDVLYGYKTIRPQLACRVVTS